MEVDHWGGGGPSVRKSPQLYKTCVVFFGHSVLFSITFVHFVSQIEIPPWVLIFVWNPPSERKQSWSRQTVCRHTHTHTHTHSHWTLINDTATARSWEKEDFSSNVQNNICYNIIFRQTWRGNRQDCLPSTHPPVYKGQFKFPPDRLEEHDIGFGQKTKFPEEETNKQAWWDKAALVTIGSCSN